MDYRIPVIIDTDVDIDDWMAMLYLLKHPGVQVLGITTTGCGAAHLTPGARNARDLLLLSSYPETPVAAGTSAPLVYSNQFPNSIRLGIDQLFGLTLPANPRPLDPRPAGQLLRDTLLAAPTPVTILAIGGGTNLGTLLRDHPEVKPKIARVVVMGGAIGVPGNIYAVDGNYLNTVAEWNIFLDPLGAKILLGSGVPITLVPLDASQYVPLNAAFYARLTAHHKSRAAEFIHDALTADLTFVNSGEFFFWDPLAAAILVEPGLAVSPGSPVSPQVMRLDVVQALDEEKDSSGQLVKSTQGPNIDVAMWANAEAFYQRFLEIINLPDSC
jgi:pyrimidine-specific ribonucleoside hydrolase